MNTVLSDLSATAPITATVIVALLLVVVHSFTREFKTGLYWMTLGGIFIGIYLGVVTFHHTGYAFNNMLMIGGFASLMDIFFLSAAAFTILLSRPYLERTGGHYGEYYPMILFATIGMMTLATATDLIMTFIGLEVMSVTLYVLAGWTRKVKESNEAALKYFLLGAFATGFLLYGIALIYGASGTTNLVGISENMEALKGNLIFIAGCGLLLIGLAFKVAAVPFHLWVPDVYDGSPTSVSAFMSTGAKGAAFAALALIFSVKFEFTNSQVNTVIALLAVISMVLGNVVAIAQTSIKRMLAYSSIAHAGYMLIGMVAGTEIGVSAILFYIVAYMLTNLGAFGVVSIFEKENRKNLDIEDYAGLARRRPVLAALMAVFMFSLAGIPPLAGFFGKYYLFLAAVESGYTWLAIVGVAASLVSVYYYLRVVVLMYFHDQSSEEPVLLPASGMVSLGLSAAGIFLFGILPSLLINTFRGLF